MSRDRLGPETRDSGLAVAQDDRSAAPILRATRIVRRYGSALALRGVDCTLWPGERVVLLGPNGSGKTTLIRVLATAIRPHGGSLAIHGIDALRFPARVRGTIGVLGHQTYLYDDLTLSENLRFYGRLYAVPHLEARIRTALDEVGLGARASDLVRTLSRGMQQRVALARAVLHEPSILLLDEPESGLDEQAQRGLAALVSSWAGEGRSVLFASHRLEWAQQLADRAIVLRDGTVVCEEVVRPNGDGLRQAYREALETPV